LFYWSLFYANLVSIIDVIINLKLTATCLIIGLE
jgi:hypothetical protein